MKKVIGMNALLLGSLALLNANAGLAQDYDPVAAEKSRQRHETTGLLGGMVLGGLVAGPPGVIVSAVAGALAGNHVSDRKEKAQLQASLAGTREDLLALQEEKARLELALADLQSVRVASASFSREAPPAACCADSALTLHFRTNSVTVEPHYQAQLKDFAALARQTPDAVIQIIGHADRRGEATSNLGLSQQRVMAVVQALKALGMDKLSYQTVAHGEKQPVSAQDSLESNFFDRRVELHIRSASADLLSQAE